MSPQFVDFNADGHIDIVAGTFDGSPHIAFGSKEGFSQPVYILDSEGQRIVINQFWNREGTPKWDNTTRCDPEGHSLKPGHLTSAAAFDWDGNGVWDLLLGDYKEGYLYLRMNNGTNAEPKFETTNRVVMAGGEPLKMAGKLSTMRPVDWDNDGRMDLVIGSFRPGEVCLFRNTGEKGKPEFAKPVTLIPGSSTRSSGPSRPEEGLYPDVVDWNGDGKLDLIVGGYSSWNPAQRDLNDEETARVAKLQEDIRAVRLKQAELFSRINASAQGIEDPVEARKKVAEERAKHSEEINKLSTESATLQRELDTLVPRPQRVAHVWVYLNGVDGPAAPKADAEAEKKETASRD